MPYENCQDCNAYQPLNDNGLCVSCQYKHDTELEAKLLEESTTLLTRNISSKRIVRCILVHEKNYESRTGYNLVARRYKFLLPMWDEETGMLRIEDISKDIARVTGFKFVEGKYGKSGVQVNNWYNDYILHKLEEKLNKIPIRYDTYEY